MTEVSSQPDNALQARLKAFFIHFLLSLLVFLILLAVTYYVWFPHALFSASGGLTGLKIVILVDVVLGPLLTLVIFNVAKPVKELTRDISIIIALQLVCLVAGIYLVYQAKPLAVVHVFDTFHVLQKSEFEVMELDYTVLEKFPGSYPKLLYIDTAGNIAGFVTGNIFNQLNKRKPFQFQPDKYLALPDEKEKLVKILDTKAGQGEDGCIKQNISSVFLSGLTCFDTEKRIFSSFDEGVSISTIDDLTLDFKKN